jgi:hypothetical protein
MGEGWADENAEIAALFFPPFQGFDRRKRPFWKEAEIFEAGPP